MEQGSLNGAAKLRLFVLFRIYDSTCPGRGDGYLYKCTMRRAVRGPRARLLRMGAATPKDSRPRGGLFEEFNRP